jgi:hypothetical protein
VTRRASGDPNDSAMTGTYVLVLVVEAVVIAALWALGRYFG